MSGPVSASYRAPCRPFDSGCRQCGAPIADSRAYCSVECSDVFQRNHFWNTASYAALERARPFGPTQKVHGHPWRGLPVCSRCFKVCQSFRDKREAEVNHIKPLNGTRPHFGCCHHQDNLEVVCHDCHVQIGIEQRAAGLIGRRVATRSRRAQEVSTLEMGA